MEKIEPRKSTVEKYTEAFKKLLDTLNSDNKLFSATEFCRFNYLPNTFLAACIKLNYIGTAGTKSNTVYFTSMCSKEVDPYNGRQIAIESLKYNRQHKGDSNKEVIIKGLEEYSVEEILRELKSRGYTGTLQKVETVNI